MTRKSDRVRVSELAVGGSGIVSFEVIPYDTVLCILRREPLEAAGFGRANAPYFTARGKYVDTTHE